jgi:hypothetical protein
METVGQKLLSRGNKKSRESFSDLLVILSAFVALCFYLRLFCYWL